MKQLVIFWYILKNESLHIFIYSLITEKQTKIIRNSHCQIISPGMTKGKMTRIRKTKA